METLKNSNIVKYSLIGAVVILLIGLIGVTSYYLYTKNQTENPPIDTTSEKSQSYPKKTIVEEANEENVVRIIPSKEDTIQIKDPEGNYTEVPKPSTPPSDLNN